MAAVRRNQLFIDVKNRGFIVLPRDIRQEGMRIAGEIFMWTKERFDFLAEDLVIGDAALRVVNQEICEGGAGV